MKSIPFLFLGLASWLNNPNAQLLYYQEKECHTIEQPLFFCQNVNGSTSYYNFTCVSHDGVLIWNVYNESGQLKDQHAFGSDENTYKEEGIIIYHRATKQKNGKIITAVATVHVDNSSYLEGDLYTIGCKGYGNVEPKCHFEIDHEGTNSWPGSQYRCNTIHVSD